MEKIVKFIILACIFVGCTEYERPNKQSFKMTVSNSLPVQFWINGQETFNEKDVCGITKVCWCQPFECTDDIKIRLTSTIEPTIKIFQDDVFFAEVSLSEVSTNEWDATINFSNDFDTCVGQFIFYITTSEGTSQFLINSNFSSLSGWDETGWVLESGKATYEFDQDNYSAIISQSFSEKPSGIYSTSYKWDFNQFGDFYTYDGVGSLVLRNNGTDVQTLDSASYSVTEVNSKTFSLSFTADESFDEIEFRFVFNSGELAGVGDEGERVLAALNLWDDPASPNEWVISSAPTIDFDPGQLSTTLHSPSLGIGLSPEFKRVVVDFDLVSVEGGSDTEIPITSFHDFTKWVEVGGSGWVFDPNPYTGLTLGDIGADFSAFGEIHNEIHEEIQAFPYNPMEPFYGSIKKVTVDFTLADRFSEGGTTGNIEMKCEFYSGSILVATSTNQIVSGLGSHTNVFNFNDGDTFDNVRLAVKRNTGSVMQVLVTLTNTTLSYTPVFESLDLDLFLSTNDSGSPMPGGTTTPFNVTSVGNYVHEFSFNTDGDLPQVEIRIDNHSIVGGQLRINSVHLYESVIKPKIELDYLTLSEESFAYKSDCISIKESHPCTVLMNYSNNSNFDGIVYADQSPNLSFNLRIPAIFFEEQNTKESEDIELSNNEIVRLYDKIEEKRELRIGFMPHHMHRKTLLALSHDFVIIDSKDWLLRDEYKKNEGNRHYPLRTGTVLLTDKNFIKENQL